MIISKSDVVPTSSKTESGRRAPNVRMDFLSEGLGLLCNAFFAYLFASRLGIFTGITNKGWKVVNYMKSGDGTSMNESANGVDRDMSQPPACGAA
jgi:hypothetical protein